MRSRIFTVAASLVLLICFVCPIVEMFDRWDNTPQNGSDTEYTFVVLAICAGAVLTIARIILGSPLLSAEALNSNLRLQGSLASGTCGSFFVVPIALSPPLLSLRI